MNNCVGIFFLFLCIIFHGFLPVCLESVEPQSLPTTLKTLLSGKITNPSDTAQEVLEKDIPLALAFTELLQFKAAHQELPFSPQSVKEYRHILEKRFQNSSLISPVKTENFPIEVPKETFTVSGHKIQIPLYFKAGAGLMLFNLNPSGDSPNPFPIISAHFQGEEGEVQVKMVLGGKEVEDLIVSQGQVIYNPGFTEGKILAVGTHTVQLAIKDGKGQKTSRSWTFTVGMEKHSGLAIPQGAKPSGQLTFPAKFLFPGCHPDLDGGDCHNTLFCSSIY